MMRDKSWLGFAELVVYLWPKPQENMQTTSPSDMLEYPPQQSKTKQYLRARSFSAQVMIYVRK